jgi:hypothetical protein
MMRANTPISAGAGAYVFAKRQINAERQAKLDDIRKRKQAVVESLEYSDNVPPRPLSASAMGGTATPEASSSSAAPPEGKDGSGTTPGKSKYEAQKPFVSPKGDRFA